MLVLHDPLRQTDLPRGCVATIGNFDGMHVGHQSIVRGVVERARALDRPSTVITFDRSEEHTSELQSPCNLVCRLLLEKKHTPIDALHYVIFRFLVLPSAAPSCQHACVPSVVDLVVDLWRNGRVRPLFYSP